MPRPRVLQHTNPITTWPAAFERFHELWGQARESARALPDVPDCYDKREWADLLAFLELQARLTGGAHPPKRRDPAHSVKSRRE